MTEIQHADRLMELTESVFGEAEAGLIVGRLVIVCGEKHAVHVMQKLASHKVADPWAHVTAAIGRFERNKRRCYDPSTDSYGELYSPTDCKFGPRE